MSDAASFDPRIVVRPRTLDETFDLALSYVRLYMAEFGALFAWLTGGCIALLVALDLLLDIDPQLEVIIVLILGPVTERAVTVYGGRHLFGHAVRLRAAVGQAVRRLPFALVASTMANLPLILILSESDDFDAGFGVFGIMLGLFWPFVLASYVYLREVMTLEHLPFRKAQTRARALIQYRYERGVGLLITALAFRIAASALVYTWIRFTAEFVFQFSGVPDALITWAEAAAWIASGQFLAVVRLFDYVDARTRREGWDIQIRFDAIKQRDEAAQARRMAA